MGWLSDLFGGSEGTPATVQDIRSTEDISLRNTSGGFLEWILSQPGMTGVSQLGAPAGPFAAPMTGGENTMLNAIRNYMGGGGAQAVDTGQRTLTSMASGTGAFSPLVTGVGSGAGFDLTQNILKGNTMNPATDAMLRGAITTAQRPLLERFGDQMGDARGAFTLGGQFVQPGASSPFELAKARLQTGLADAMGDVATNISYANLAQERQRQADLLAQQNASFESGANRQLGAATATVPFTRGVLDSLVEGLRVEALPRMIEQGGIDAGVNEFNTQRNAFLNLLMQAFGASGPQPVAIPGQPGTTGLIGGLGTAAAAGAGAPLGAAFAKLFL